ncbi:MAG: LuxR C-terminal-related transcriptional regulator [Hyphomonadaceae bacterium]|nr:LuxR C-terminal-related transcriptional regulator [Hyphomonadaceae bacterium]
MRLVERIAGSTARVSLIVAPVGFGKTALLEALRDKLQEEGVTVSFLTPGSDRRSLTEAAQTTAQKVALIDNGDSLDSGWLQSLIESTMVSERSDKLIICMRDLTHVDFTAWLLDEAFDLYRARDLAFTERETYSYLHANGVTGLTVNQISELQDLTDGWPVAVRLARDFLNTTGERYCFHDLKHHLTGAVSAVLKRNLSSECLDLLGKTSAFDRFNMPMLRDVFGDCLTEQGRATLENWCLPAGGRQDDYLRLHGLVRDCLRRIRDGDRRSDASALKEAVSWFCRNGLVEDAIDYALRAEDWAVAQDLLALHGGELVQDSGAIVRFLEWVETLEQVGQTIEPSTSLWRCWALVFNLRLDEAERIAEDLSAQKLERADRAHLEKLWVSIHARQGDPARLAKEAEAWLSKWKDEFPFHAAAVATLSSLAHYALSNAALFRQHLWEARRLAAKSGSWYARAWVLGVEALYELESGQPDFALKLIAQALDLVPASHHRSKTLADTLSLIQAAVYLERGERDLAHAFVLKGIGSWNHHGLVETSVLGSRTMALVLEDVQGCDDAVAEIRRYPVCEPSIEFAHSLISTHLFIRSGKPANARVEYARALAMESSRDRRIDEAGQNSLARVELLHCEAWLLFAEGLAERAKAKCQKVIHFAKTNGRGRLLVSAWLLDAGISFRNGDQKRAEATLRRAIHFASQNRLADTFIRDRWPVEKMLMQLLPQLSDVSLLPEIRQAIEGHVGDNTQSAIAAPDLELQVEPLTERELDVLQMLDSCMSAKSISQEMNISLATLKWHIQNIYSKLNVNNRSGALHIARELCIL